MGFSSIRPKMPRRMLDLQFRPGALLRARPLFTAHQSKTEAIIAMEDKYGSRNYAPIPVVLSKGRGKYVQSAKLQPRIPYTSEAPYRLLRAGVHVWDVEGHEYVDFLSGYSAVNQGHCHPRLVEVMQRQCAQLTLVSRAFHSDQFAAYAQYICTLLGYDRVLPMNTGVETGETALKLARRWAYDVKKVPKDQAIMV